MANKIHMLDKLFITSGCLLALVLVFVFFFAGGVPQRPTFDQTSIVIIQQNGLQTTFQAEVARTPEHLAYGLMYMRELPQDRGMIFLFDPPRQASFWMKNTFIPLDMLFIGADHKIVRIAAQTTPHDLTSIHSYQTVLAVIEINGGLAQKYGINVGDLVQSPVFGP